MSAPDYSPADVWALMVERVMGEPCVYYEGRDCRDRGLPETWCDRCELLAAAERVEVTEGSAHGSDFVATTTVLNPELSAALLTMRKDAGDE